MSIEGRTRRSVRLLRSGLQPLRATLRGMPVADRWSVLLAFVMLVRVERDLADSGEGSVTMLLHRRRTSTHRAPAWAADRETVADQLSWAVETAGSCLDSRCLAKALVLDTLLRRRRYPSEVVIGVRRGRTQWLTAHAWVELDSMPVHEVYNVASLFPPIVRGKASPGTD